MGYPFGGWQQPGVYGQPPEGQTRARLYVTRKAGAIRNLKAASDAPGGELAGELLQKMQQPK